jgi:hypothetical protein
LLLFRWVSSFVTRLSFCSAPHTGLPYDAGDPELTDNRIAARKLMHQFNTALAYDDVAGRTAVMRQLLGSFDEGKRGASVRGGCVCFAC